LLYAEFLQDETKAIRRLLSLFKIPAAQFANQHAMVGINKLSEKVTERDVAPTNRHVRISLTERDLMGLLFLGVIDRVAEVVMHVAMCNQRRYSTNFRYLFEIIKFRSHMEMAKIQVDSNIVPVNPVHL